MLPWLQNAVSVPEGTHPGTLALRLILAFVLGLIVAAIYRVTNGGQAVPSFRATLVLLTILIAAVTQVIGDNVARAFSLVGALSIVRFRTVVQDTRDTAFVIFAVTVGMAVGAGDLWVAGLSLVVISAAATVMRARRPRAADSGPFHLAISLGLGASPAALAPVFEHFLAGSRVTAVSTANRGAAIETTYEVRLRPETDPAQFVERLNDLEGVQSVQLRPAT